MAVRPPGAWQRGQGAGERIAMAASPPGAWQPGQGAGGRTAMAARPPRAWQTGQGAGLSPAMAARLPGAWQPGQGAGGSPGPSIQHLLTHRAQQMSDAELSTACMTLHTAYTMFFCAWKDANPGSRASVSSVSGSIEEVQKHIGRARQNDRYRGLVDIATALHVAAKAELFGRPHVLPAQRVKQRRRTPATVEQNVQSDQPPAHSTGGIPLLIEPDSEPHPKRRHRAKQGHATPVPEKAAGYQANC